MFFRGFDECVQVLWGLCGLVYCSESDRLGKKFGFLSFRNVNDVKRMEGVRGDVWMGSYKLFVVRARFVDGERVVGGSDGNKEKTSDRSNDFMAEKDAPHEGHANPNQGGVASRVGENSRSYRDTFLNKNVSVNQDEVLKIDDSVEGYCEWHKLSVCARLKNYKVLSSLDELLKINGGLSAAIKYGGWFNVLLVFNSEHECASFLDNKGVWDEWVVSAAIWTGQVQKYERIAWLRVHGIPISLAVDEVIEAVGKRYGKVVQPACYSSDEKDFSYAYIGVLCGSDSRVDDRFSLFWRGKTFKVWVDEDVGEWSPECIEVNEDCELEDTLELESGRNGRDDQDNRGHGDGLEVEMGENGSNDQVNVVQVNVVDGEPNTLVDNSVSASPNQVIQDKSNSLRKKFRKKNSLRSRVVSPGENDRPKKRAREDSDYFGVDRLIGILNRNTNVEVQGDSETVSGDFCTPDLNKSCAFSVSSKCHNVDCEEEVEESVSDQVLAQIQKQVQIDNEEATTVALGRALGVDNLCYFGTQVKEQIVNDGFQIGDQ
ncbi:hypothetical protein HanLR1_Chr16g0615751 [Helianthus annuus]|nr:hypothetical protein HanLR1_Chr16g0615751 [Helianthus annuus]